jgi:hypothetical protein
MIRQALRSNPQRRQTAVGASIPAPTGGWNARDPLSKMPPEDAVILDNVIPRAGYVEVRRGSRQWASGAAPVESLLVWRGSTDGADKLFAVMDDDIYNATTLGTSMSVSLKSLLNSRVQYTNFSNDGGAWIICVNGEDTPFSYNGTAFADLTITGSSGSLTLDPDDLIDVLMHKRRLFFTEVGTLRVWFLGTDEIQGTANLLDLGSVMQQGGTLRCMGTWSLDGGQGQDDYIAFLSDQGEVAVYQGTDPTDANNWALVGVFSIGIPLGRRALFKFGADLLALTTNGVLPFSQALRLDRAQDNDVAITAKVINAFAVASQSYSDNFGWEGLTYQRGHPAIYNLPVSVWGTSYQYVQNLQTGSWCRFTGLNASCWAIANESIYFGAQDGVDQWDVGVTDRGEDLVWDIKTAFGYFGSRGRQKHFTMIRPIFLATQGVTPAIAMLTDFQEAIPTSVPITTIMGGGDLQQQANWTSLTGVGFCGAVRMRGRFAIDPTLVSFLADGSGNHVISAAGDNLITASDEPVNDSRIQIISFDVLYERGGVL